MQGIVTVTKGPALMILLKSAVLTKVPCSKTERPFQCLKVALLSPVPQPGDGRTPTAAGVGGRGPRPVA